MWGSLDWWRVVSLADYNTRVVIVGATLLAAAAGMVGTFALLRRRALLGDALCHAALPGIAVAFLVAEWLSWDGKSLVVLLSGGAASGLLGAAVLVALRRATILPDDAAMGIVLSVFFGAGIVLLSLVQQMEAGHAAGLETFLYGRAATLLARDAWAIALMGAMAVGAILLLFKELKVFCFDHRFAAAAGYSSLGLDGVIMVLVAAILLVGLQAVGLILMVALLVIPPAAARFWTDDLMRCVLLAGAGGALSGLLGAASSAVSDRLPTGAAIVLVAGAWFGLSLIIGFKRGLLVEAIRRWSMQRRIDQHHVLRACFEVAESRRAEQHDAAVEPAWITWDELLAKRRWSVRQLRRVVKRLERSGLVLNWNDGKLRLTAAGFRVGAMLTHYHRLWELYLLRHGEVAVHRVDASVDEIEHVLDPELTRRLEHAVLGSSPLVEVASPHPLPGPKAESEPREPGTGRP